MSYDARLTSPTLVQTAGPSINTPNTLLSFKSDKMADGELEDIAIIDGSDEGIDVTTGEYVEKTESQKPGANAEATTSQSEGKETTLMKTDSKEEKVKHKEDPAISRDADEVDDLESAVSGDIATQDDNSAEASAEALTGAGASASSLRGQKFELSEAGVEVYVTHSPKNHGKLVVLLTNSLGLASRNNLKLADTYAEMLNCPVIVPDLFDKDPLRPTAKDVPEVTEADLTSGFSLSKVKALAVSAVKGFMDEMWVAKHTFDRTYPKLCSAMSEIVQLYKPSSIGVIGYSFGGRYALRLLEAQQTDEWSYDEDLVAVGASIHPSLVEADDFACVAKPLIFVYPAQDPVAPDTFILRNLRALEEKRVELEHHVFDSEDGPLPHGFAVPGDYSDDIVGSRPREVIELVSSFLRSRL